MKTVSLITIPHARQRYPTVGDWQERQFNIDIATSELSDWRYEFLVLLHEFIEFGLCKSRGITGEQVDAFDFAYTGDAEPGDEPAAPYHREHQFATIIERLVANELGVSWDTYDQELGAL